MKHTITFTIIFEKLPKACSLAKNRLQNILLGNNGNLTKYIADCVNALNCASGRSQRYHALRSCSYPELLDQTEVTRDESKDEVLLASMLTSLSTLGN